MGQFFGQIGYYLTHPQAIIYTVATALLYPVLFVELAALIFTIYEFGRFTYEMIRRDRHRSPTKIEKTVRMIRDHVRLGQTPQALSAFGGIGSSWVTNRFVSELAEGSDMGAKRLVKLISDLELAASARLERTRILIRFGPSLGLMGTLIPISPALVALAKGDVDTLSSNLVVAFSTTVVGLLIGALAYIMSAVRDRLYTQDISDIEYALDLLEE